MKRLPILILLSLLPAALIAQPMSIRHLLRSCDTGKEVTRIHLPPVLIRMASWFVDEDETRDILRNVNSLYLVVAENNEYSRNSDFPSRVVTKLDGMNFQTMMTVNDNGEKVSILMREKSRDRKEMIIAVDGDEDVVLYLKGKLDFRELMNNETIKIGNVNAFYNGKIK